MTNYFSLFSAGSDWIKAFDNADPLNITSERGWNTGGVVYSTRPFINVTAGTPSQFVVNPAGDVPNVPAGSLSAFGNYPISARLADAYDNFASSAGIVVNLSTFNVVGATGTISTLVTASSGIPPTATWTAVTDSSGSVGVSSGLYYYVSHTLGDSAQVQFSAHVGALNISNTTGHLITAGGTTSKLVVVTAPVSETAGVTASFLTSFVLERRDDFDNPTGQGNVSVVLDDTANSQVATHAAKGFSPSTHDFEFETAGGTPISGLSYTGGVTQQSFVYFDRMSSTPLEDGRVGTWALQAYVGSSFSGSNIKTQYNLIVNPAVTAKVGFHNPQRTLQAGLPLNPSGDLRQSAFHIEMQDINSNPTPALSTITVQLASYRVASSSFDAYGFSVSTAILPPPPPTAPGFSVSTTSVLISSASYGTTFYYMDTNASENYNTPASSPTLIAWVNGVNWSTGTQAVTIVPNSIYKIGMLSAPAKSHRRNDEPGVPVRDARYLRQPDADHRRRFRRPGGGLPARFRFRRQPAVRDTI